MLSYVHPVAPFLIVAIDIVLASPLSNIYSSWTGIKADRLLMTFRLFAAWLLSLGAKMRLQNDMRQYGLVGLLAAQKTFQKAYRTIPD